jgi:hypothetical protein
MCQNGFSAFTGKEPPLRRIDSAVVPVYFSFCYWQKLSSILIRIVQRSMDAVGILLQDRTLPYCPRNKSGLFVSDTPRGIVFDKLDVLAIRREDGQELLFSRLKYTECRVRRAINDLYVFQRLASFASANAKLRIWLECLQRVVRHPLGPAAGPAISVYPRL